MRNVGIPVLIAALAAGGAGDAGADEAAPTGLICELLAAPADIPAPVADLRPEFGWIVPVTRPDDVQTAFRLLVASDRERLDADRGDLWDSGRVASARSLNVEYAGAPLAPGTTYVWKVRTWNGAGESSPWSAPRAFAVAPDAGPDRAVRWPVGTFDVAPAAVGRPGPGRLFLDFGRAAFGFLRAELDAPEAGTVVTVRFGEKLTAPGVIDAAPGGCIRFAETTLTPEIGRRRYAIHPSADKRNTSGAAIPLPEAVGVVIPFRYAELSGLPPGTEEGTAAGVRQAAVRYPADDAASRFASSDGTLNRVWDLCKYTIQATTFAGVYVDGDRERIPYEADAYINQLGHYGIDREYALARYSHEYLLAHPTWPTEWRHHSVFMAWADYLHTGDVESLVRCYPELRNKTLEERARGDGLLVSTAAQIKQGDIVDWPAGERDGFVFTPVNAVVNAFYHRVLVLMGGIAEVAGKPDDAARYREAARRVREAFTKAFFDARYGVYVDGEGTDHASLHANLFPLAFGLVPDAHRRGVAAFVKSRGMACSVYGAQYLLEALYEADEADHALDLMTAGGDRGWVHMLDAGSTMTWEAWDVRYKKNLDWNHAWGAAPANIIPRYLMGVRPLEPGFGKVLIHPRPGRLRWAEARVPTIRGPIDLRWDRTPEGGVALRVVLPGNLTARVGLPASEGATPVRLDGRPVSAAREGSTLWVDPVGSGTHVLEAP